MDARRQPSETNKTQRTRTWKVGQLAERTGLSVRALHHYEEIGLLVPPGRTEAGHRLYTDAEVLRLQQIASLRALGLSLGEIRRCLDTEGYSPVQVIGLHITRLRERIASERRLCERLEGVAALLADRAGAIGGVSAEGFVETVMEVTRMSENVEKHYTAEQLEQAERHKEEVGEQKIQEVRAEWPKLIAKVEAEMDAGTDPANGRVQDLAGRWMGLVEEMTGGDQGILRSMNTMWHKRRTSAAWTPRTCES